MTVKLNVSTSAGGKVAFERSRFDAHLNNCSYCRAGFCAKAEALWRAVCLAALRAHRDGAPERLAEEVLSAPVVEQHPSVAQSAQDAFANGPVTEQKWGN